MCSYRYGRVLRTLRERCLPFLFGEVHQFLPDLIPYPPKHLDVPRFRRVIEAPVDAFRFAREDRAVLVRVVADRDDVVELLPDEFFHRFRPVSGDIDTYLPHRLDRLRPHEARDRARAVHFKSLPAVVPQQPLRNLATSGIARTQYQHPDLFTHTDLPHRAASLPPRRLPYGSAPATRITLSRRTPP